MNLLFDISVLDLLPVITVLTWAALAVQLCLVRLDTLRNQAFAMAAVLALCIFNELVSAYIGDFDLMQRLYPLTVVAPLTILSGVVSNSKNINFLFTLCYVIALSHLVLVVPDSVSVLKGGLQPNAYLATSLFTSMVLLGLVQFFMRPLYKQMLNELTQGWGVASVFAALGALSIVAAFEMRGFMPDRMLLSFNLLAIGFMIVLFVVVLVVFRQTRDVLREQHDIELARAQSVANAQTEELRQRTKEEERRRRHDQRHALQVVIDRIEAGEIDVALEQLRAIRGDVTVADVDFCREPASNSVFKLWSSKSEAEGIDITIRADVPKGLDIEPIELSNMFANLLENAYEGCMRLERQEAKRFIDFNCGYDKGRMKCTVRNSCRKDVEFDEGMPRSQKRDGGGIGTRSVRATVEAHNGRVRYSSADGVFTTQLMMAL